MSILLLVSSAFVVVIGLVAVACVFCLSVLLSFAYVPHVEWSDEDTQPGNPPLLIVLNHIWHDVFWLDLENPSDEFGLVV